jgi:hypothetical protein
MDLTILKATPDQIFLLNTCDNSFQVEERLSINVVDGKISYTFVPVEQYTKHYSYSDEDYSSYLDDTEKAFHP